VGPSRDSSLNAGITMERSGAKAMVGLLATQMPPSELNRRNPGR
jgi:hypothetical protein